MNTTPTITIDGREQTTKDRLNVRWIKFWIAAHTTYKRVRAFVRRKSMKRLLLLLFALSVALFASMLQWAPDYSVFGAKLIMPIVLAGILYIIDKVGFSEISTIDRIKDDPVAYVQHLRSYALLLAAGALAMWGG